MKSGGRTNRALAHPPHRGALRPTRSFHIHKFHKTASGRGLAYLSLSVRIEALLTLWNEYLKHAEANMPEKIRTIKKRPFWEPMWRLISGGFRLLAEPSAIYLFTKEGENDVLNNAAKTCCGPSTGYRARSMLREFDLDTPEAKKRYVTSSPTFFSTRRTICSAIRGALRGEGRTHGRGDSAARLSDGQFEPASEKILRRIDSKREVKVFVSPPVPTVRTRPKCGKGVVERPDIVSLEI